MIIINKNIGVKIFQLLLALSIILAIILFYVVRNVDMENSEEKIITWSCAQKAMEDNLKTPSTAKFPHYSEDFIEPLGNNKFRVNAYVNAENSFGTKIRTNFTVIIEIINNGKGFRYNSLLTY